MDAKKLDEALAIYAGNTDFIGTGPLGLIFKAASAYAATLPREVEMECWATFTHSGALWSSGISAAAAQAEAAESQMPKLVAVRLTGTAVLPRVKD